MSDSMHRSQSTRVSTDEFVALVAEMSEEEWFSHDLTKPCERGTKRCVAAHKLTDRCNRMRPARFAKKETV